MLFTAAPDRAGATIPAHSIYQEGLRDESSWSLTHSGCCLRQEAHPHPLLVDTYEEHPNHQHVSVQLQ